jgi:hypothetical protein
MNLVRPHSDFAVAAYSHSGPVCKNMFVQFLAEMCEFMPHVTRMLVEYFNSLVL